MRIESAATQWLVPLPFLSNPHPVTVTETRQTSRKLLVNIIYSRIWIQNWFYKLIDLIAATAYLTKQVVLLQPLAANIPF